MENTQVVFDKDDYRYMKQAITQAKKAYKLNEVPIGCVIVYEGKVIGRGYNRRNTDKTSLGHAEITAIKKASRYMGDWRATDRGYVPFTLGEIEDRGYGDCKDLSVLLTAMLKASGITAQTYPLHEPHIPSG